MATYTLRDSGYVGLHRDDGTLLRELPLHVGHDVSLCCGEAIWTMGDDGIVHVVGLRRA